MTARDKNRIAVLGTILGATELMVGSDPSATVQNKIDVIQRRAQWEIREMAQQMLRLCQATEPVLFENCGPGCLRGPCPEGRLVSRFYWRL
jgi:hypothetical protein